MFRSLLGVAALMLAGSALAQADLQLLGQRDS